MKILEIKIFVNALKFISIEMRTEASIKKINYVFRILNQFKSLH